MGSLEWYDAEKKSWALRFDRIFRPRHVYHRPDRVVMSVMYGLLLKIEMPCAGLD